MIENFHTFLRKQSLRRMLITYSFHSILLFVMGISPLTSHCTELSKFPYFSQEMPNYLYSNFILATYSLKLKIFFANFLPKYEMVKSKVSIFKPPLHQFRCRNSYFYSFTGIKNYKLNHDTISKYVLVISTFVLPF